MRYIFFFLIIGLLSCSENNVTLPNSTGSKSEILFVSPDYLWENKLGDIVINFFASPIPGIAKNENSFKVLQVNEKEFSSLLKTHTNIVLITSDTTTYFKNNLWANDQLVTFLFFKNDINQFNSECKSIFNIYYDKEISAIKNKILNTLNKAYTKKIYDSFRIKTIIPKEYSQSFDAEDQMLFSYNPQNKDIIKHILIYKLPVDTFDLYQLQLQTNSFFKQHLKGPKENSYVEIETLYPLQMYNDSYRGLWKLKNGFMGGPLIIKPYYLDDQIIVSVAIVFDPKSSKRTYIKEFEAIL